MCEIAGRGCCNKTVWGKTRLERHTLSEGCTAYGSVLPFAVYNIRYVVLKLFWLTQKRGSFFLSAEEVLKKYSYF